MPEVLIVCSDLFFASPMHGAAKQAGFAAKTALSGSQALKLLDGGTFAWVVVDLELPQLDLDAIVTASKTASARTLAFGPHVRTNLLEQAQASGFERVLTRGQVAAKLADVLSAKSQ